MSDRTYHVATAVQPSARHVAARQAPASPTRRLGNQNTAAALRARHDRLAKLAEDPGDAHRAWRRLSPAEQEELLELMRERYGKEFADRFFEIAEAGTAQTETQHWGPGVGPTPHRMRELDFWRKVEAQITRNSLVRVPCCEEQPGNFWFNCSSVMGRDDE